MDEENIDEFQYSFFGMLLSFLAIMIAAPLTSELYARLIVSVFLGFILISSMFSLTSRRTTLLLGVFLCTSSLIFLTVDYLTNSWWNHLLSMISASLLIGLTIIVLFRKIFKPRHHSTNTIFGSICVFLLLGFFFSLLYGIIEHIHPGSFGRFLTPSAISDELLDSARMFQNFLYYSFVTQTTLGYGDIVPQTYLTQNLAVLQAITGQFYLAVLVAGIIGKMLRNKD